MVSRKLLAGAAVAAASVLAAGQAAARTSPPPARAVAPHAPLPSPAAAPSAAMQSDAMVVLTLIRATLVAVDQADVTGNYTVLRDLASPGFREKNTDADLARIFTPIRNARIDMSPVVVLDPHLTRAALTQQRQLDVAGSFDTKPAAVTFELLFQPIGGAWRLNGIAVRPASPSPAAGR